MPKPLNEMTNEELWRLFPIILSEHDEKWKERYLAEEKILVSAVGKGFIERISHIGSTAVKGLIAKPTVDILLEIKEHTKLSDLIENIKNVGYLYSPQKENPPPHMMFMKGYTPQGFLGKVFHVHVRYQGDWDELVFRDYLIGHPETARAYGELKKVLKEKFEHDRDGYTDAKTEFIQGVVRLAREN